MDDKGTIYSTIFLIGVFVAVIGLGFFVNSCDALYPYQMDATKIDMVKRGYAVWDTQPDGSTKFILKEVESDTGR